MADLGFPLWSRGTPLVWGQPGGTIAPTPTSGLNLTLLNLANNDSREGPYADLQAGATGRTAEWYEITLILESGAQPTANSSSYLYFAETSDLANIKPGETTDADALYLSGEAANSAGLPNLTRTIFFRHRATANLRLVQAPILWRFAGRYIAPIVYNASGAAFRNNTTATDHASRVVVTPIYPVIQDTAP